MNNKGKNGTNVGGNKANKAAVRWVFPPAGYSDFVDKGGETILLCKQSYPYLGDCHSLLLR